VLFSQLRQPLLRSSFHSGFRSKVSYALLATPVCTTRPAHSTLLDLMTPTVSYDRRTLSHNHNPQRETSPRPCHFLSTKFKHSPQQDVLEHTVSSLQDWLTPLSKPFRPVHYILFSCYLECLLRLYSYIISSLLSFPSSLSVFSRKWLSCWRQPLH
jgi:hypothetical protein